MIFVLGASGYVGQAFVRELARRQEPFRAFSRANGDYTNFRVLLALLRNAKPDLVLNCAGFTGRPNVDACEVEREATILGNIVLAQTVAEACDVSGVRLGSLSSGCIYHGAKFRESTGEWTTRTDLNDPALAEALASRSGQIRGYSEEDAPNFTLATNGSFYSGTKAVAEKVLRAFPDTYIWRLRLPFDERDHPRNYLTKLQTYARLYQNWNSLSHLGDSVAACLDTWKLGLPGGIYNVTSPGYASTREVAALLQKLLLPKWTPAFWRDDADFYGNGARAQRSNCLLDTAKLAQGGIKMRSVEDALADSLRTWTQ